MARSRAIVSGALWLLIAQLIIATGQVLYSGITARRVSAEGFAEFAVALNLVGLLNLVATVGLASFTMSKESLSAALVTRVRLWALGSGISLGILYVILGQLWFDFFDAPGAAQFEYLLTFAVAMSPSSAVESALYRRDARTNLDAVSMLLSFALASGAAVTVLLFTDRVWALALVPAIGPVVILLWASVFRTTRYPVVFQGPHSFAKFVLSVGYQSAFFFIISSIPLWALSASTSLEVVGQYTRAAAITLLLATAMSTAINRAVQPYWRHLSSPSETVEAIKDGFAITSWASFGVFGVLAITAPSLVHIWLGEGWDLAGRFSVVLAISCAIQVPVGLMINALEMKGKFGVIQRAQVASLISICVPTGLLLFTGNPFFGVGTSVLAQLVAGAVLLAGLNFDGVRLGDSIRRLILREATCIGLPLTAAGAYAIFLSSRTSRSSAVADDLIGVGLPGSIAFILLSVSFRYSHTLDILARRMKREPNHTS